MSEVRELIARSLRFLPELSSGQGVLGWLGRRSNHPCHFSSARECSAATNGGLYCFVVILDLP